MTYIDIYFSGKQPTVCLPQIESGFALSIPEAGTNFQIHALVWKLLYFNSNFTGNCSTHLTWWRHNMEAFSVLLVLWARKSPVTGEFHPTTASDAELCCFLWSAPEKRLCAHYDVTVMKLKSREIMAALNDHFKILQREGETAILCTNRWNNWAANWVLWTKNKRKQSAA